MSRPSLMLPLFLLVLLIPASLSAANKEQEQQIPHELLKNSDMATELDNVSDELLIKSVYESIKRNKSLLTPEQRAELNELERQQEEALKNKKPATGVSDIKAVTLLPGSKTAPVYVTPGWDSHITFIDLTGQPWPIEYYSQGNKEDFPFERPEISDKNLIKIGSKYRVGSTNITIGLKGLKEIFSFDVIATKSKYHNSRKFQIARSGPNHSPLSTSERLHAGTKDQHLLEILHGGLELPKSFTGLPTTDSRVKAWASDGALYLLTSLTLRGVEPEGVRHGTGGMKAYKTDFKPTFIMSDSNGISVFVNIEKDPY